MKPISFLFQTLSSTLLLSAISAYAVQGDPIPGVDVSIEQSPSGLMVTVKSDPNGHYQFKNLAPGKYKLCVKGQSCNTVTVGTDGIFKGQATRADTKK